MNEWMTLFRKYLTYESQFVQLVGDEDEEKAGILQQVHTCVCQNINLYTEKYEEEFNPFLQTFLKDVWTLLLKTSTAPKYDMLVSAAIRFMTSVTTSIHFELFKDPQALQNICEKIVVPNLELRDSDIVLFEDNPVEYIRRDIEGSDSDTRRKSATELVKGLRKHYEVQCTEICSSFVTSKLQIYLANPKKNWKEKDLAIYLVTALAIRGTTVSQGTTSVNQLVPIMDFFKSQILPEIQSTEVYSLVLKADALKFVSTFRQQLPKDIYIALFPFLINNLCSSNYVIHTYSASCIEKLLTVKDKTPLGIVARFSKNELKQFLAACLENLFKVLSINQSKENDYIMKTIMRVISTAQEEIIPYSTGLINQLINILIPVCKNPSNPSFNHYLFESIAAVIKNTAIKSPDLISMFEKQLLDSFKFILLEDIQEFSPYVFQIISLMLESSSVALTPPYLELLQGLTSPTLWEKQGNIPALVRLLQAYLHKGGQQIVSNHLLPILGVFQKLVASKSYDHEGFYILEAIVESIPPSDFSQHMPLIFTLIFTRLSKDKTLKFVKSFLVFLSIFIGKHGPNLVLQFIDTVQKDLFANVLDSLWLPNVQKVSGNIERKVVSLAMTKLLAECPVILNPPYFPNIWMKILSSVISVLEEPEDQTVPPEMESEVEIEDIQGYTNTFSQLGQAIKSNQDPFKEIEPKQFLALSLNKLCKQHPQKLVSFIQTALGPEGIKLLISYFKNIPQLQEPYLM